MEPPFAIKTMEFMEIMMTLWSKKIRLVTICCPEPSENNRYKMGYIEGHCTETALLRVQNDILMELDKEM